MCPGFSPTLRGFWHAHEPPRRRVSTHETHSRSCTPTIVPWVTPLGTARLPWSKTCGRSPKPRLSLPRVRISTPSNVPYMYRYHIDPGGSRERVALPLSARLCGQWAGCAPPRRPLQGTMFVLSEPVADNVSEHVRLIWKVQRVRTRE